jgi:hypothetical protein
MERVRFCDLERGATFEFRGTRHVKLALSLAEKTDGTGTVFQAETPVERVPTSEAEGLGSVTSPARARADTGDGHLLC